MSHAAISFAVLGGVVILLAWHRFPPSVTALAGALVLYGTGVLSLDQTLAGFADPTVIFIASLFVVSEGLQASGLTSWAGQRLIAVTGSSTTRLLVLTMASVALLAALITLSGAVSALLPVAVLAAVRLRQPTSRLLMPLAFAASAGSLLALTGSPVNVLISGAAERATGHGFGYFSFALVGLPSRPEFRSVRCS